MSESIRALRGSLVIAGVIVAVDQLTKEWALRALDDGPIDVVWTLRFNLVFNRGMAFSQGEGLGPVIGVVALVVVAALLVSLRRGTGRLGAIGVGLVVGGALGNVVDRLVRSPGWFRGAVVDFIDFQWFPVFNVADMAINVGAAMLILGTLLAARRDDGSGDDGSGDDGSGDGGPPDDGPRDDPGDGAVPA